MAQPSSLGRYLRLAAYLAVVGIFLLLVFVVLRASLVI